MSEHQSHFAQSRRWQSPYLSSRSPVLASYETDWDSISLEYQKQTAGETITVYVDYYTVSIFMGPVCQFKYVLDGCLQTRMVSKGAITLCPANHSYSFCWDRDIYTLGLNLRPHLLMRDALELFGSEHIELTPHAVLYDPLIFQIAIALKADLESHNPGGRLYAEHMANSLSIHLLTRYSKRNFLLPQPLQGLAPRQLKPVIDYINNNLEQDLGLDDLAAIAQLSQYHFSRAFKNSIGLSPYQYVIRQRVERAKQLLKQGEMGISEVAIACGFTHQSHLNRHFKRLTGVTPKAFLKS